MCVSKLCVHKLCVDKLCASRRAEAEEEEARECPTKNKNPTQRCGEKHQNQRTATAAHTRCPPSPPAATLHRNTHGFVLRLPPQSKPHATSMQPLQCVLQRQVANPHLSTHMATERDNNHAAIPLRSATTDSKTPYNYAHTNASKAASTHRYSVAAKIKGPDNRQEREKIWWRIDVCKKCMSKGGA